MNGHNGQVRDGAAQIAGHPSPFFGIPLLCLLFSPCFLLKFGGKGGETSGQKESDNAVASPSESPLIVLRNTSLLFDFDSKYAVFFFQLYNNTLVVLT